MEPVDRYDSLIRYTCQRYNWPWWLRIKAQLLAESSMNPKAVSPVGAKGLAQFMPPTWEEWGKGEDPFNPEAAIDACVRYMQWLYARFDGIPEPDRYQFALAAYHAGLGNIQRMRELAPPSQRNRWADAVAYLPNVTGESNARLTEGYVRRIMATASTLEREAPQASIPSDRTQAARLLRALADALEAGVLS